MSIPIELPAELFSPAAFSHYQGEFSLEVLKAGPDFYDFKEPVSWNADITNTGEAFLVTGTVEGRGITSCARCLDSAQVDFFGEIEGYYIIDPANVPKDMEGDEFELLPDNHTIDLEPLIRTALLLEVPYAPLCEEDCKGLCLGCGVNLNHEECTCGHDDSVGEAGAKAGNDKGSNNPFAVLKNLDL